MSPTLTTVLSVFTPMDQVNLDQGDVDFGPGGVLVLPDQPGATPHLAVAAGKTGMMFLMNEDNLGGYSTTKNNVLGTYSIGGCWCGQSYFVDPSDGLGRVVSSGGGAIEVFKIQTSPKVALKRAASGSGLSGRLQDPGFFLNLKRQSNSDHLGNITVPTTNNKGAPIRLFAFDPESGTKMTKLFEWTAGNWPNTGGNANLVPVVANGLVFVASNQQLQVFGLAAKDKLKK